MGIYIYKETWNTNSKEYIHLYVIYSVIYNHEDMEAAQVPISRWLDKSTMVHLHNGLLLSHKKEENFTLCDSMDGPGEHYAKWNKPVSNISSCWKIQAIYQSTKRENALWISLPRYSI